MLDETIAQELLRAAHGCCEDLDAHAFIKAAKAAKQAVHDDAELAKSMGLTTGVEARSAKRAIEDWASKLDYILFATQHGESSEDLVQCVAVDDKPRALAHLAWKYGFKI